MLTGEIAFTDRFGTLTSLEIDLLNVASAIYCADLGIKRGEREAITRAVEMRIPVVNIAIFLAVREEIEYALFRLSHDAWKLEFLPQAGTPEELRDWEANATGKVLLFSGGLDSLAAALQLGEQGESVTLTSHITANQVVSTAQTELESYLNAQYPGQFTRFAFRVGGRNRPAHGFFFPSDDQREGTQRTRSFLFLTLAALVARRRGVTDVVMIAENGQMAIHLPLSAARIGAFSTHTAHPDFIATIGPLLSRILQYPINVYNPFVLMTKAEVVLEGVSNHLAAVEKSISCWKASRISGGLHHCGFCIPCLIRRIAIEFHGTTLAEYSRDLLTEDIARLPSDDDGKRNLIELLEFIHVFGTGRSQAQLEDVFPDLINPNYDRNDAADMYRRFASEALQVLTRYPQIAPLLR